MSQSQPQYKFCATLLDAFTWYKKSEKEEAFPEFLDKLNRVPFTSEAADKGTAFNELVDNLCVDFEAYGVLPMDDILSHSGFDFPGDIVREFVAQFAGCLRQIYVERTIQTRYGPVLLYGYVDELLWWVVYDIKTTKSYDLGKYTRNWQHKVYLYCLIETGIDTFQYTVTDFDNTYKEEYTWKESNQLDLQLICEELIDFVTEHRELITDKKLFALENVEV